MEKHISFDIAPKSWFDRCSGDGHERIINENGEHVYKDDNTLVSEVGFRPCSKCGEFPNADGDDACLSNLGRVMNACCGHGKNEGYIQFDNGLTVRGYFKIEKTKKYDMEYEIRSREDILNKIKDLSDKDSEFLKALKWVMRMK